MTVRPAVKYAITNSSTDRVKTTSAAATIPGRMTGSVIRMKVGISRHAEVQRGFLDGPVEPAQPGPDDRRGERGAPDRVGDDDRHDAEREADQREERRGARCRARCPGRAAGRRPRCRGRCCACSAPGRSASSVPRITEMVVATTAISSVVPRAPSSSGFWKTSPYQRVVKPCHDTIARWASLNERMTRTTSGRYRNASRSAHEDLEPRRAVRLATHASRAISRLRRRTRDWMHQQRQQDRPSSSSASVDPNGQSRASRNCWLMRLPIMIRRPPPSSCGTGKFPRDGHEDEDAAGHDPGQDQRQGDGPQDAESAARRGPPPPRGYRGSGARAPRTAAGSSAAGSRRPGPSRPRSRCTAAAAVRR